MRIGPSWPPWGRLTASCAAAWPAPRMTIPPDMPDGDARPRDSCQTRAVADTTTVPPSNILVPIRDRPMVKKAAKKTDKKVAKKPAKRPPYRLKDISDEQMNALQRS